MRHELLGVELLSESFSIVVNIIARHEKSYGFLGEISCKETVNKDTCQECKRTLSLFNFSTQSRPSYDKTPCDLI